MLVQLASAKLETGTMQESGFMIHSHYLIVQTPRTCLHQVGGCQLQSARHAQAVSKSAALPGP